MRRLLLLFLFGLALFSVWFFASRTPSPNEQSRQAVGSLEILGIGNSGIPSYWSGGNALNPEIFLIASAGRGAHDFNELVSTLNEQSYRTMTLDPPGVNSYVRFGDFENLQDFSKPVLQRREPTILIGHAFGNRVARMAAYQNPENIKAVILLAAGGQVPMEPKAEQSLRDIFNPMKSHKARMEDVRYAFFADGNDIPDHWTRGWHTKTAIAQGKAVAASAGDDSWHCAGGVPMLIVQPMQDRIAPIENAYALRDKCPQEIEIVEVQNAGHALLPEQPEAVADAVLAFLAKHHPVD
jgi:pimeloyl-ACP methyl ester carboxylesterase